MKKLLCLLAMPLILSACVDPQPADVLVAARECVNAGIPAHLPAHAVCVDVLITDIQDQEAENAMAGMYINGALSIASLLISLGALSATSY